MDKEILYKLYSNPQILNYLRFNPEWYKILYHEPDKYKDFEERGRHFKNIVKDLV